jgi:hypothetical protein
LVFVDKVTTINCQGWICVDFYVVEGRICVNVYVIEGWKCKPILLTSKKLFIVLLQKPNQGDIIKFVAIWTFLSLM